jgi:phosphotriesterase-related protein
MDYIVTNPGIEQLDLIEEEGGDPAKVIIGHAFIEPQSVEQIIDICKRGANVQVDHMGIPWRHDSIEELDDSMANMMCEVADRGHLSQMTITYDRWFFNPRGPATVTNPQLLNEKVPLDYLFTNFARRLEKKGFRMRDLETILVENPQRILAAF